MASLTYEWLTPWLAVSGQIQPEGVSSLASEGFASIINNRPDNEEDEQPSHAEVRSSAEKTGLRYAYLPVVMGRMNGEQIEEFASLLSDLPRPVFAFCRSGARVKALYRLAKEQRKSF